METNHEYDRYQKARKQVEDIKGFYSHLASYILVMGLLIFINLRYSPQLLLENTIKHNVVSEQKPLHIKIYIENNYLIVENNLQKKEVLQDRKGVGLQNIVNRYGLISERKVLVEQTETAFKVKIPILTKQIVIMETQNIYNENMAYVRAKERVEKLKGFYGNLISYCFVIPILIFINLKTSNFHWFWFPMLGWGMGLTFHALETFGYGKSWEEKKIREILNKENNPNSLRFLRRAGDWNLFLLRRPKVREKPLLIK